VREREMAAERKHEDHQGNTKVHGEIYKVFFVVFVV
jgi:hypothetical protein